LAHNAHAVPITIISGTRTPDHNFRDASIMSRSLSSLLLCVCLLACALHAAPSLAQELAYTNRATDLKADNNADSATLAQLVSNTPVQVSGRSSGWARVTTGDKKVGWIRAFHLRYQNSIAESEGGGSIFGGIFSSQRRTQRPTATATVGIRGLSEEDMKNAKPNPAEYAKYKGYAVSKAEAEAFARRSRLIAQQVSYVDWRGRPVSGGGR
jgi:hypothetical protein